jgi:hypothetical protein
MCVHSGNPVSENGGAEPVSATVGSGDSDLGRGFLTLAPGV